MNLSPRARELVALQQTKYLRSLADKKTRLEQCWHAIQRDGWIPEWTDKLKTQVHRLSGSAGSYGLTALSEAAHDLDLYLANCTAMDSSAASPVDIPDNMMEALFLALNQVIDNQT